MHIRSRGRERRAQRRLAVPPPRSQPRPSTASSPGSRLIDLTLYQLIVDELTAAAFAEQAAADSRPPIILRPAQVDLAGKHPPFLCSPERPLSDEGHEFVSPRQAHFGSFVSRSSMPFELQLQLCWLDLPLPSTSLSFVRPHPSHSASRSTSPFVSFSTSYSARP